MYKIESETNWNFKTTHRIVKWLCRHKDKSHRVVANYESSGTAEVRMYNANPTDIRALVAIRIYGVADLVVDTPHKTGNTRCYCYAELRDTIRDWLKGELNG